MFVNRKWATSDFAKERGGPDILKRNFSLSMQVISAKLLFQNFEHKMSLKLRS